MIDADMRRLLAQMSSDEDAQIAEFVAMDPRSAAKDLQRNPALAREKIGVRVAMSEAGDCVEEASADIIAIYSRVIRGSGPVSSDRRSLRQLAKEAGVKLDRIATDLDLSLPFVKMLDRRAIAVESIPSRFIDALARCVSQTSETLRECLSGPPVLAAQAAYLSDARPEATEAVDFEYELSNDPSVPDSGRRRWSESETSAG